MINNFDMNEDLYSNENDISFFANNFQSVDNILNPLNLSPFPSLSFYYQNSNYEQQSINIENREQEEENKKEMNLDILSKLMDGSEFENEANLESGENYANKVNENKESFKLDEKEVSKPKDKVETGEENEVPGRSKKTDFTSKEVEHINPVLVEFHPRQISKRIDYHKKFFKTNFVKFLKKHANDLIKNSGLPKELKKKISAPNHISFTANVKDSDNREFLSFIVQDIFTYFKKGAKCSNSLQIKNQNLIKDILAFIESNDEEKYEDIKSFFKMTVRDAYSLFYESEDFMEYAAEPKTIYLDKEFIIQKGFSLLEKNGFIKMCEV